MRHLRLDQQGNDEKQDRLVQTRLAGNGLANGFIVLNEVAGEMLGDRGSSSVIETASMLMK
jgi:hypothetical protein